MYRLEVIERCNDDESIVFSIIIPVPKATVYVYTEDTMCAYIRSLDIPWHAKDAYICKIWFPLHRWFPKNFYRFVEVEI